jgi:hypothetical protein
LYSATPQPLVHICAPPLRSSQYRLWFDIKRFVMEELDEKLAEQIAALKGNTNLPRVGK